MYNANMAIKSPAFNNFIAQTCKTCFPTFQSVVILTSWMVACSMINSRYFYTAWACSAAVIEIFIDTLKYLASTWHSKSRRKCTRHALRYLKLQPQKSLIYDYDL